MTATGPAPLRYVALGDSYTVGTSVDPMLCWPVQLVQALGRAAGSTTTLQLVGNLGVNGYTSGELIRDELPELDRLRSEFVSVLIGVNDVVRGISVAIYEANIRTTLQALLVRLPANRIVTVAIPDYTVTPQGAAYGDPRQQSREIVSFNEVMGKQSAERGIRYVDTYDLSLRAAGDRSLVAADGLHPSGAQYGLWVERIAPVVADLLARQPPEVIDLRA